MSTPAATFETRLAALEAKSNIAMRRYDQRETAIELINWSMMTADDRRKAECLSDDLIFDILYIDHCITALVEEVYGGDATNW